MTTLTRETIQVPRNWFHQHWVRTGASALPGREVTQRDWDGRFYREEYVELTNGERLQGVSSIRIKVLKEKQDSEGVDVPYRA